MSTDEYDKVTQEIRKFCEDEEYRKICKFLNELMRDRNSGQMNQEDSQKFEGWSEALKVRKEELEVRLAESVKKTLESYFSTVEGDEMLHISRMDGSLFNKIRELDISGVHVKRDGSTKEITFSNYNPDIADNDYEELEFIDQEEEKTEPQTSVKDIIQRFDNFIDNLKTIAGKVRDIKVLGYEPNTNTLHFEIIQPTFTGNCKIDKYRIRTFNLNSDEKPIKEELVYDSRFQISDLTNESLYYFTVEPGNELGFQSKCRKFYISPIGISKISKEVLVETDNQFMQIPESPHFSVKTIGKRLFSIKPIKENGMNCSLVDFSSSSSSLCLLDSGEMLECGMVIRFKNEAYTDKDLPIEEEADVVIGITNFYSPLVAVPIISVSCGLKFCMALSCLGDVYSWGENERGQLGQGDYFARALPSKIKKIPFIKKLTVSYQNVISVDIEDKVFVWGKLQGLFGIVGSKDGPLVVPGNNDQNIPRFIGEHFGPIKTIACGNAFNVIATDKGELYVSGSNDCGQLGFDHPNQLELPFCDWPHKLLNSGVVDVKVSGSHVVVRKQENEDKETFLGFGRNKEQQIIKDKEILNVRSPTPIDLPEGKVSNFWLLNKSTIFEFTDLKKKVFGKEGELTSILSGDATVKISDGSTITVLKH
jgi:hypothetical protein